MSCRSFSVCFLDYCIIVHQADYFSVKLVSKNAVTIRFTFRGMFVLSGIELLPALVARPALVALPALVAQTGTGGAVCKGATPSVEQ